MAMKLNIKNIILGAALLAASCTNLDERPYSQMMKDDFLSDPALLDLYTARPYTMLQNWGHEQSMFTLLLQLTNEVAIPKSYEGSWAEARYGEVQSHEIPASNKLVRLGWDFCFNGISACNDAIAVIQDTPDTEAKTKTLSDLRVLRTYYYLLAVDCWGNVPFSIDKNQVGYPEQKDRAFMLKWIEDEIEECMPHLEATVSSKTYGRVTKGMAQFILAKIYLNSEKWTGTARYAELEAVCKDIMGSGNYSLTPTYAANFAINAVNGSEAIFVIPYSSVYNVGEYFYIWVMTFNDDLTKAFNLGSAWNGSMICQPDFFDSYESGDTRKDACWLYGQVYDYNGQEYKLKQINADKSVSYIPYVLEPSAIDESKYHSGLSRMDGARIVKWPYQTDGTLNTYRICMENDFILMRYSDVVLMYVEALVRQGRTAEAAAVPEFQQIRRRAGLEPMTADQLTLHNLLLERQHELCMEGWSRQDLIRFGEYTKAWWAKEEGQAYMELLPIPDQRRADNPNLEQNTGYND